MTSKKMARVYLGKPYNREFWWNTAARILNEHHRGKFDGRFTRNQNLPDAANLHKNAVYMVGGTGVEHVGLSEVVKPKYRRAVAC